MAKWDKKLKEGGYEQKPIEDSKDQRFRDKVDAARITYAAMSIKDLLFHFHDHDSQMGKLEEEIKSLNVERSALGELIKQHFENMDVRSVQTEFGATVYLQTEPSVSDDGTGEYLRWVKADPEREWMLTVNAQTRKSHVKDLWEQGLDDQIPPGLRIYADTQVRIRKT